MGELRSSIFAALDAFLKRAADRRAAAAQIMREALAARPAASGRAASRPGAASPGRRSADPLRAPDAAVQPQVWDSRPAANTGRRGPASPNEAEAGLVRGIFANPQSLAAAFIAAEVLAKPVALRDS